MNSFTKALFHVQLLVIENPSKTHQQNIHAYISKYKAKQQKKSFLCVDGNVRLCVLLCSNVDMFAENIHEKMRNNKKKLKEKIPWIFWINSTKKNIFLPLLVLFIVRYFMNYSNISLLQKYIYKVDCTMLVKYGKKN